MPSNLIAKFYLHAASSTLGGTLPGATTLSTGKPAAAPHVTAAGASTNRAMDDTIGVLQASRALTTLANTTEQANWFGRWLSPALDAQSIPVGNWTLSCAASHSNSASAMTIYGFYIGVWRPSSGSLVSTILDYVLNTFYFAMSSTSETAYGPTAISTGAAATLQAGDVIVYEAWTRTTQTMGTAYTNTIFYDGTTEGSATSNAAFLTPPAPLALEEPPRNAGTNHSATALLMEDLGARWEKTKRGLWMPTYRERAILA